MAMSSTSPNRLSGVRSTISVRSSSMVSTTSRAEVATEPTAIPFTRTRGARSAAISRVRWARAALAVP